MSHAYRRALGFGLLFHFLAGICSAQVQTGAPPLGSFGGGPDVIDLANLNVHVGISVLHKPGRGTDFTYDLSYDTSVWYPVTSGSTQSWQAVPNLGWRGVTEVSMGYISYAVGSGVCQGDSGPEHYHYRYNWAYHDFFGSTHSFPNLITLQGTDPWQCSGLSPTGSDTAVDGSGYSISATAGSATIYSVSGTAIKPPINLSSGAGTFTDRNGNQITVDSSGNFYDTLSSTTPVLTVAGAAPNPTTFTYTAPSAAASFKMNYTSYTVKTSFGVSGIAEYGPTAISLVASVVQPDGTQYSFTYEQTPGACTPLAGTYQGYCVTARLASVTLPTGGQITYSYSAGYNGIFSDGSTATLTRTTPDGAWIYARTLGTGAASTTTVTNPKGDHTVLNFQGIYETQRQVNQLMNGSQTLLQTVNTCYNGGASPCTGTAIALPITQRSITTLFPGGLQSEHDDFWNTFGMPTEVDDYDFGAAPHGPLLKKILATYAALNNYLNAFRQSVIIQDGGGHSVSQVYYNYDEGVVSPGRCPAFR